MLGWAILASPWSREGPRPGQHAGPAHGTGARPWRSAAGGLLWRLNTLIREPVGEAAARLTFHQRLAWSPAFANTLIYRMYQEPSSSVMECKTFKAIQWQARGA